MRMLTQVQKQRKEIYSTNAREYYFKETFSVGVREQELDSMLHAIYKGKVDGGTMQLLDNKEKTLRKLSSLGGIAFIDVHNKQQEVTN